MTGQLNSAAVGNVLNGNLGVLGAVERPIWNCLDGEFWLNCQTLSGIVGKCRQTGLKASKQFYVAACIEKIFELSY